MKALTRLILITATICLIEVQGVDDYSDSKRPYEFGFTIDGQQHRHEKKDKNGIIMGEFGFITADDVYHVTVYATDENGRFKILSMKNIHLKATPSNRQDKSLTFPSASLSPTLSKPTPVKLLPPLAPTQLARRPQNNIKSVSIEPPVNSCSHCSIPTTTTVAPKLAGPPNTQTNINSYNNNPSLFNSPGVNSVQSSQGVSSPSLYPGQQNAFGRPTSSNPPSFSPYNQQSINIGSAINGQTPLTPAKPYNPSPNKSQNNFGGTQYFQQVNQRPIYSQPTPSSSISPYNPRVQNGISYANQNGGPPGGTSEAKKYPTSNSQPLPQAPGIISSNNIPIYNSHSKNEITNPTQALRSRKDKQIKQPQVGLSEFNQNSYPQSGSNSFSGPQRGQSVTTTKPTLLSAQMQIVDKNTNINYKRPGERDGLPKGVTENDIMNLLYTFNYTLGFQAHYEEGYTNGFKQGYYYVTGRNGVRTRIDYTADDTGFHPKISQDVLDLLSDDVPKPETEKDAKYGLRGYEFKWLYYPEEHKTR